jgi:hypothetical protein
MFSCWSKCSFVKKMHIYEICIKVPFHKILTLEFVNNQAFWKFVY